MFACVDVSYYGFDNAVAACVYFEKCSDATALVETHCRISKVMPYSSGQFYRREMPCVLKVLGMRTDIAIDLLIIDGYVWLSRDQTRMGLGAHIYKITGGKFPVVGVAKSKFLGDDFSFPVVRGKSRKPLWVTSVGVDLDFAANFVTCMDGSHRIPTLLSRVDRLTKIHERVALLDGNQRCQVE